MRESRGMVTTDLYYSSEWQLLEERAGSSVKAQYIWAPVYLDALICRDRDADANGSLEERLYTAQDANFTVLAALDTSGNAVERFALDAFGLFSVLTPGRTPRTNSSFDWTFLHQGGRYTTDSGFYSYRHRDYSPSLGRWAQRDPVGFLAGDVNVVRTAAPEWGLRPGPADGPAGPSPRHAYRGRRAGLVLRPGRRGRHGFRGRGLCDGPLATARRRKQPASPPNRSMASSA
jgi:RHS repeat-associated protein